MLLAAGAGNLAGGLLGALPLTMVRSAATAVAPSGVRGRGPVLVAALCTTALLATAGAVLPLVPAAAIAGIMLTIGLSLADGWSHALVVRFVRQPAAREAGQSLAIVALVAAATAFAGTAVGVGLGVLMAAAAVMRGMRGNVIRGRFDGHTRPSRRVRQAADEALLAPWRGRIQGLELQGALFFASVDRVADACDALPPDTRHLVLDLRRLGTIDDSGAALLQGLRASLAGRGVTLMLASVDASMARGRRLAAFGLLPGHWYPDADRAIEAAEESLLAAQPARQAARALRLADSALLQAVPPGEAAWLDAHMPAHALAAGERLFAQGDEGDALFVVTRGAISICSADGRHRFATYSPGTVFGEMALLDGGGRTANAVADEPSETRSLSRAALAELQADQPALAAQLHRNLALHLAQRLRVASSAWQAAAG